jgi:hypothetical protein
MDRNQFEAAMELSTEAEAKRLAELRQMLAGVPEDSLSLNTRILGLNCRVREETADCFCEMEDEEARYDTQFRLQKVKGEWRVDLPTD